MYHSDGKEVDSDLNSVTLRTASRLIGTAIFSHQIFTTKCLWLRKADGIYKSKVDLKASQVARQIKLAAERVLIEADKIVDQWYIVIVVSKNLGSNQTACVFEMVGGVWCLSHTCVRNINERFVLYYFILFAKCENPVFSNRCWLNGRVLHLALLPRLRHCTTIPCTIFEDEKNYVDIKVKWPAEPVINYWIL